MAKQSKPGRPQGSANVQRDLVEAEPSRCRKCGSTDRDPYFGTPIEVPHGGTRPNGQPFTHVLKRRTRCSSCGQHRIDLTYENRT